MREKRANLKKLQDQIGFVPIDGIMYQQDSETDNGRIGSAGRSKSRSRSPNSPVSPSRALD